MAIQGKTSFSQTEEDYRNNLIDKVTSLLKEEEVTWAGAGVHPGVSIMLSAYVCLEAAFVRASVIDEMLEEQNGRPLDRNNVEQMVSTIPSLLEHLREEIKTGMKGTLH